MSLLPPLYIINIVHKQRAGLKKNQEHWEQFFFKATFYLIHLLAQNLTFLLCIKVNDLPVIGAPDIRDARMRVFFRDTTLFF